MSDLLISCLAMVCILVPLVVAGIVAWLHPDWT